MFDFAWKFKILNGSNHPIVCWVSTLNRKHDAKLFSPTTHGVKFPLWIALSSKSPWAKAIRYQRPAKNTQVTKKLPTKASKVYLKENIL